MSKHTPGPWHAHNSGSGAAILSEDNRDICGSVTRYPWTEETHLANLALITAAPEILAALKALRFNIDVSTINNSKRSTAKWEELIDLANAAISKAESKA